MKKIFAIVAAIMMAVGCNDDIIFPQDVNITFIPSIEGDDVVNKVFLGYRTKTSRVAPEGRYFTFQGVKTFNVTPKSYDLDAVILQGSDTLVHISYTLSATEDMTIYIGED